MSFNISLSGLNAASNDLSVTSNDIANVGTTGYSESCMAPATLAPRGAVNSPDMRRWVAL